MSPYFTDTEITEIARNAARSPDGKKFLYWIARDGTTVPDDELKKIGKLYQDEVKVATAEKAYGQPIESKSWIGEAVDGLKKGVDNLQESAATTFEGRVPLNDEDTAIGRFVQKQRKEAELIAPSRETVLGDKTHKAISEGMESVPLSLGTSAAGFVAGSAASGGNPLVGATVAMGTTGALMYKPAKQQFIRQVRDALKEQYNVTPEQWDIIQDQVETTAQGYGIDEVKGEGLSEFFEYLLFRVPIGKIAKPIAGIIGKTKANKILNSTIASITAKTAGTVGVENIGEGVTQEAQTGRLAETPYTQHLAPDYDPNAPYSERLATGIKEVAGATTVASLVQAGGLGATSKVLDKFEQNRLANIPNEEVLKRIGILEAQAAKGVKLTPKQEANLKTYKDLIAERTKPPITKDEAINNLKKAVEKGEDISGVEQTEIAKKIGITKEDIDSIIKPVKQPENIEKISTVTIKTKDKSGVQEETQETYINKDTGEAVRVMKGEKPVFTEEVSKTIAPEETDIVIEPETPAQKTPSETPPSVASAETQETSGQVSQILEPRRIVRKEGDTTFDDLADYVGRDKAKSVTDAALVVKDGTVYTGNTHLEALELAESKGVKDSDVLRNDMFLTSEGKLITREEADSLVGTKTGDAQDVVGRTAVAPDRTVQGEVKPETANVLAEAKPEMKAEAKGNFVKVKDFSDVWDKAHEVAVEEYPAKRYPGIGMPDLSHELPQKIERWYNIINDAELTSNMKERFERNFKSEFHDRRDEISELANRLGIKTASVPTKTLKQKLFQVAFNKKPATSTASSPDKATSPNAPTTEKNEKTGKGKGEIGAEKVVEPTKQEEATITTPKAQKKYLLDAVDDAMGSASKESPEIFTQKFPTTKEAQIKWSEDKQKVVDSNKEKFGTITIEVPNDGTFEILNTKQSLAEFKKQAQKFQVTAGKVVRQPAEIKPSGKRIQADEVQYYNAFKPRKQGLIEGAEKANNEKANHYIDGWFINGEYGVITEKPKMKLYPNKAKIKDILPKDSELEPIEFVGEFSYGYGYGETPSVHAITKSGKDIVYSARYIDSILTEHPNAKAYSAGETRPLIFKDKGKPVGIIMPRVDNEFKKTFGDRIAEITGRPTSESAPKEDTKYSLGEANAILTSLTEADVKDVFKWADSVKKNEDGTFNVFKNGQRITVESVDHIAIDDAIFKANIGRQPTNAEKAIGARGSKKGLTIQVSKIGDKWTLAHESYHMLEDAGFVNQIDVIAINQALHKEGVQKPTFEDRAVWVEKNLKSRAEKSNVLAKVLQKIQDLIDSFVNLFQRTAKGVLRDIESGKIGQERTSPVFEFAQSAKFSIGEAVKKITDNPKFVKWFGDSKVVDESGKPLVVYHGRFARRGQEWVEEINQFDKRVTYFTDNPKAAEQYSGVEYWQGKAMVPGIANAQSRIGGQIMPVYLSMQNPLIIDLKGEHVHTQRSNALLEARKKGHDGIIFRDGEDVPQSADPYGTLRPVYGDVYAVFSPTQIKSIFNTEFDPTNPDIRYSLASPEAYTIPITPDMMKRLTGLLTGNPDAFFNQTGMIFPSNDTKDLYRGIRWLQTMYDLARNYPEMRGLLNVQTKRLADSHALTVADRELTEPFFKILNGDSRKKVGEVLFKGDETGKVFTDNELKQQFELDDKEIMGYRVIRQALDNKLDLHIKQLLENITKGLVTIKQADVEAVKTAKGIDQFKEELKKLGFNDEQIDKSTWMLKWIDSTKGYMPHKWDAKWLVKIEDIDKREYLLEIKSKAAELLPSRGLRHSAAQGQIVSTIKKQLGWSDEKIDRLYKQNRIALKRATQYPIDLFEGARVDVMQSLVNEAKERVFKDYLAPEDSDAYDKLTELKMALNDHLEEMYLAKGWGRHLMGRRGVLGYRRDAEAVIAEYLVGANSFISKGKAAKEFAKAFSKISPKKNPVMWQHGKEYISDMLGESNEAGMFKKIAGTYFLAADLSSATLNLTQNFTHAMPLIKSIDVPDGKTAEMEVLAAMNDIAGEFKQSLKEKRKLFSAPNSYMTEGEINFINELKKEGNLDPQYLGETTGFHSNQIWNGYVTRIWSSMFYAFTGAEGWNRTSTALAAYRRSRRAGMNRQDAKLAATDIINSAHGMYGKGNRPLIVRRLGALGNIGFTFMAYPINNLVFLKHRAEDILNAFYAGDKVAVKRGLKVFGSNLGYLFALGGLIGLPFAYLGQIAFDIFDDDEDDWEILMRKYMQKDVGRAVTRGLPAALIGNDLSWRVQGTDVIGMPIGYEMVLMAKKRIEKAKKMYQQDRLADAFFALSPDVLRSPYTALTGYVEGGEKEGRPPIKYTYGEMLTRSAGFTPTREAEAFKVGEVVNKKNKMRLEKLGDWSERWLIAMNKKDAKSMDKVRMELFEFNKRQREKNSGISIKMSEVIQSAQRRKKERAKGYLERWPKKMSDYQQNVESALELQ